MTIKRLSASHATVYRLLRLRGLRESPTAFGSSYAEEIKFPLKTFIARLEPSPAKGVFGAFEGKRLVGIVTLIREERKKQRHKASIYGMYVKAKMRGKGIGRQLINRAVAAARRMRGLRQVQLSVIEANRPAVGLYESAGFKIYGREEAYLHVAGKFYAALFLVRRL